MKHTLFAIAISCITLSAYAQDTPNPETPQTEQNVFTIDSSSVLTIDSTIKALYNVISGEKGQKRNWDQMKFLFYKDAKLIPSGKNKKDMIKARYMSTDDYIKGSEKWLVEHGFFEKEIHREVQNFGNIAHVFSTYACFHSAADETPFMRGINSIQLLNDGERWWIVNIFWTQETEANPIPEKYLPVH